MDSGAPANPQYSSVDLPSPRFTGQEKHLRRLHEYFVPLSPHRKIFLLYGMGGVGKTQICLKFAEETSDRYVASGSYTSWAFS